MTPEEILQKQFGTAIKGYKPDEVNAYLAQVAEELQKAQRQRDEFQGKLEVLAEKLEEYRGDEESLRAALIGAQKLGDGVVREARKKAEQILTDASRKADSVINDAKRNIDAESYALSKLKLEVSKFRTQILNLYQKQVELVKTIPYEEDLLAAEAAAESRIGSIAAVQAVIDDPEDEVKLEYDLIPDEEPEALQQRGSRFGALRFGDEFKLERNE